MNGTVTHRAQQHRHMYLILSFIAQQSFCFVLVFFFFFDGFFFFFLVKGGGGVRGKVSHDEGAGTTGLLGFF